MIQSLSVLSEPRRQEILRRLWNKALPAGEIAAGMTVTFSAVSQHLAVLLDADLVERRREGKKQIYSVRKENFGALAPALEQMWFGALSNLKHMAEAEDRAVKTRKPPRSSP